MRRINVLAIAVTIIAIFGVLMFIFGGQTISKAIGRELFGMTYQFLLVVVLGSGVSVTFQMITRAEDMRERRRELQRQLHELLVSGYNDAKRARRLLKARARVGNDSIDAAVYDEQLEALSNAQLAIELATRRVEINRMLFENADALVAALRAVENYVNTVVDEWEAVRPRLKPDDHIDAVQLPELVMFLRSPSESPPFREGFKKPFDLALRLMEKALVSAEETSYKPPAPSSAKAAQEPGWREAG